MNKNALGFSIDMLNGNTTDIDNNQSGEFFYPIVYNAKFDSNVSLETPPIKFQIAFRNE